MEARKSTRDSIVLRCPLCKRVIGGGANLKGESFDSYAYCRHCKRKWVFPIVRIEGQLTFLQPVPQEGEKRLDGPAA
jgi:hypothetical protein